MKSSNYDMPAMRREYIALAAEYLKKSSKFYKEDYDNICKAANLKTRRELIDAIGHQYAIRSISQSEINKHCQFAGLK